VLKQNTRSLERRWIRPNLKRNERVRPDVLARFYLGAAKERSDIALHIGW